MENRILGISLLEDEHDTAPTFTTTTVKELYQRLERAKVDERITQSEYMKLTSVPEGATEGQAADIRRKGREAQTRHKAIDGGYMLGRYRNDSRKSPAIVEYRSALAIDCDTLPEQPEQNEWIWEKIDNLLQENLNCSYMITETRKSTKKFPRLRIVIPLNRDCDPEEYQALIHYIGGQVLQPEWVDPTCDQPGRLMFWPTVSKGQSYMYKGGLMRPDLPLLDVDRVLDEFDDWRDRSKWVALGPDAGKEVAGHRHRWTTAERAGQKTLQADPFQKPGLIGAFCRLYPIPAAIACFLSGDLATDKYRELTGKGRYPSCYKPARNGRYTYCGPDTSTSGGAVVYDEGRYLYSHHATDPYHDELMNSWNLLQRHLFGYMDADVSDGTEDKKLPSFLAMKEFVKSVDGVVMECKTDNLARSAEIDFNMDDAIKSLEEYTQQADQDEQQADQAEAGPDNSPVSAADFLQATGGAAAGNPAAAAAQDGDQAEAGPDGNPATLAARPAWISELAGMLEWTRDQYGNPIKVKSTINNYLLIFQYDENLKGKIRYNSFTCKTEVNGRLPRAVNAGGKISTVLEPERDTKVLGNADDAALMHYIEVNYGLNSREKFTTAETLIADQNKFHPVREYLDNLPAWDGVPRAATLLHDYLGAADTAVNREVMAKHLLAAVTRIYHPGTKYDTMLILTGAQGLGKSTFIEKLAGPEWSTDNIRNIDDKDALMELQGHWAVEFAEMDALKKAEVTAIKTFTTRQDDAYRSPYGRNTESHPRQCVFFGTTNQPAFLRDLTGNRRFTCVDCRTQAEKEQGINIPQFSVFTDLPQQRDQIWAEVLQLYRENEALCWRVDGLDYSAETKAALAGIAEEHRDDDPREKLIIDYCTRPIPANWKNWSEEEWQGYYAGKSKWNDGFTPDTAIPYVQRRYVCALGIWVECLGGKRSNFPAADRAFIKNTLNRETWLKPARYSDDRYGKPRGWEIIGRPVDDKEGDNDE